MQTFMYSRTRKKRLSSCCAVTLRLPCDFDRTALVPRLTFATLQCTATPLPTQRMRTVTVAYSSKLVLVVYHEKTGWIGKTVVQREQS